MQALSDAMTAV